MLRKGLLFTLFATVAMWSSAQKVVSSEETVKNIEAHMIAIKGGSFNMSSDYKVTLGAYRISKYEITLSQFAAFISDSGYKTDAERDGGGYIETASSIEKDPNVTWKCGPNGKVRGENEYNHPVVYVSWNDANEFCKWLSKKSGKNYRLPTEAEWEYAAQGANQSRHFIFSGSNALQNIGWYQTNSGGNTHVVGMKNPNEIGVYDMTGNVWEWCYDWKGSYPSGVFMNPRGAVDGSDRILRGGSWNNTTNISKLKYRFHGYPEYRSHNIGFRVIEDY